MRTLPLLMPMVTGIAACGGPTDNATTSETAPLGCALLDAVECEDEQLLEHDVVSSLGFSADDILQTIVGPYEFSIVWSDPCGAGTTCRRAGNCDDSDAQAVPSVAGSETVLSIALTESEQPAIVPQPSPDQTICATYMDVPARMVLSTADGALDSEHAVQIRTYCGQQAAVSIQGPASVLGGTLAEELPEDASVEFTFGTFDARAWMGIYFVPVDSEGGTAPALLRSEILADERCPHDVPVEDVLRTR